MHLYADLEHTGYLKTNGKTYSDSDFVYSVIGIIEVWFHDSSNIEKLHAPKREALQKGYHIHNLILALVEFAKIIDHVEFRVAMHVKHMVKTTFLQMHAA